MADDKKLKQKAPDADDAEEQDEDEKAEVLPPREVMSTINIGDNSLGPPPIAE